jgi:hypothetical protein
MASTRPQVVIGVRVNQYSALASLAFQVVADMTAAIASFPTPFPTLATITTQATLVESLIAIWGPVGNRGSHSDLLNLRAACLTLRDLLVQEAAYVQNSVDPTLSYPDQAAVIASSGFAVKNSPVPQGILAPPQGLHQLFQAGISPYTPKLKWTKPLDLTSPNNVKSYIVYRSAGVPFPGEPIGFPTRTSFIDTTPLHGIPYSYYVVAVNTDGQSPPSNVLALIIPA